MSTTEKRITVSLTAEDVKKLNFLADKYKDTYSQIFKLALRCFYLRDEKALP